MKRVNDLKRPLFFSKKATRRTIPLILSALLLLLVTACANGSLTGNATDGADSSSLAAVGIPESLDANAAIQAESMANRYYVGRELESPAPGEGELISCSNVVVTEEGFAILATSRPAQYEENPTHSSVLWFYNKSGEVLSKNKITEGGTNSLGEGKALSVDPAGGFAGLFANGTGSVRIVFFDENGQQKGNPLLLANLGSDRYPASLYITDDETILVGGMFFVQEYSREGKILRTIDSPDINGGIYRVKEKFFVDGIHFDASGSGDYVLTEIPAEGKNLGEVAPFRLPDAWYYTYEGDIYSTNSEFFYRYDTEAGSIDPIFCWNKTDLLRGNTITRVHPLSDSEYLCVQTEYNTDKVSMTILTRQAEDYLAGKTILTVAGVGIGGNSQAVIDFNRESSEYRVEVVDYLIRYADYLDTEDYYEDMDAMQRQIKLEILSGQGPDMLMNGPGTDLSYYADSGLLVDLNTYLDQDASVDQSLYVQSVWKAAGSESTMYELPLTFYLHGMTASQELIGERIGWTPEEFAEMANLLPEGSRCFPEYTTRSDLLEEALPFSIDYFVDRKSGEVHFDSEEFGALLDFAKTYGSPDNTDFSGMEYGDFYSRLRSGGITFLPLEYLSLPWHYADAANFAGAAGISFCGFPSANRVGPTAIINNSIGIVDKGDVSAGCWEFARSLLSEENQRRETSADSIIASFPILQPLLDEYILTSQECVQPGGEYGMFEQEGKQLTKEQAEDFRALIDSVTVTENNNDEILAIVQEEAAAYFADQKTREEVQKNIQNRVQTMVSEGV